jgi:hypothetical protein
LLHTLAVCLRLPATPVVGKAISSSLITWCSYGKSVTNLVITPYSICKVQTAVIMNAIKWYCTNSMWFWLWCISVALCWILSGTGKFRNTTFSRMWHDMIWYI